MVTISLCMIVKNEEDVIGRCLESVKDLVDEINIVDTGSTDKTKQIVEQFTIVFLILNGFSILLLLETIHFSKQLRNSFCG